MDKLPMGLNASIRAYEMGVTNFVGEVSPRRQLAQRNDYERYPDYCDTHGVTSFLTTTGRCATCAPVTSPAMNPRAFAPRVEARRANARTYIENCKVHGVAAYWTGVGKCCGCFGASGYKRRVAIHPQKAVALGMGRPPLNEARAAARRTGERRYAGVCEVHGPGEFWVSNGYCTRCRHEAGTVRRRAIPAAATENVDTSDGA